MGLIFVFWKSGWKEKSLTMKNKKKQKKKGKKKEKEKKTSSKANTHFCISPLFSSLSFYLFLSFLVFFVVSLSTTTKKIKNEVFLKSTQTPTTPIRFFSFIRKPQPNKAPLKNNFFSFFRFFHTLSPLY